MSQRPGWFIAVTTSLFLVLSGCGGGDRWEVTAENQGEVPCSIVVTLQADGGSEAKVDDLAKGKTISLIGGSGETVVHTVKVVRDKDEQVLKPNAKLPDGKRYAIVVGADGKVKTSVSDK